MPSSELAGDGRRIRPAPGGRLSRAARRRFGTALLTAWLFGVLALAGWQGRVPVRDGEGVVGLVPLATVWHALLARLPAQAPGILARGPLLVGIALAGVAFAYAMVATLRLPR